MPNPQDIELKIKTEADLAALEETRDAMTDLDREALKRQQQADVETVRAKQAADAAAEHAAQLRELAEAGQRLVAGQLAQGLSALTQQYRGLSKEADLALDATTGFLTTLAATGNPAIAIATTLATAVGTVARHYFEAEEAAKKLAQTEKEQLENYAQLRREIVQNIRAENLQATFAGELRVLEAQERTLERIAKIQRSAEAAAGAEAGAAISQAERAGTLSASGADAQRLSLNLAKEQADILANLTAAQQAADAASRKALELENLAAQLVENTDEQKRRAAEAATARDQANALAADAEAQRQIAANALRGVIAQGTDQIDALSRSAQAELTRAAQETQQAIAAEAQRTGGQVSTQARAAFALLSQTLADGVVKPEEIAQITLALNQLKASREQADQQVLAGMTSLANSTGALTTQMPAVLERIRALELQTQSLAAGR